MDNKILGAISRAYSPVADTEDETVEGMSHKKKEDAIDDTNPMVRRIKGAVSRYMDVKPAQAMIDVVRDPAQVAKGALGNMTEMSKLIPKYAERAFAPEALDEMIGNMYKYQVLKDEPDQAGKPLTERNIKHIYDNTRQTRESMANLLEWAYDRFLPARWREMSVRDILSDPDQLRKMLIEKSKEVRKDLEDVSSMNIITSDDKPSEKYGITIVDRMLEDIDKYAGGAK